MAGCRNPPHSNPVSIHQVPCSTPRRRQQGDSSSESPQWNVMIEKERNRLHIYVVFDNAVGQEDCL